MKALQRRGQREISAVPGASMDSSRREEEKVIREHPGGQKAGSTGVESTGQHKKTVRYCMRLTAINT